jgi:hypothetical protein
VPEGFWKLLRKAPEGLSGSRFMASQTFVLAHQPATGAAFESNMLSKTTFVKTYFGQEWSLALNFSARSGSGRYYPASA